VTVIDCTDCIHFLLFIVLYFIGVCMSVYNCSLTVVLIKRHLIWFECTELSSSELRSGYHLSQSSKQLVITMNVSLCRRRYAINTFSRNSDIYVQKRPAPKTGWFFADCLYRSPKRKSGKFLYVGDRDHISGSEIIKNFPYVLSDLCTYVIWVWFSCV